MDSILSRMTLDEKIACLNTNSGVPRLHIPDAGGFESLHGLVRNGGFGGKAVPTTSFFVPPKDPVSEASVKQFAASGCETGAVTSTKSYVSTVFAGDTNTLTPARKGQILTLTILASPSTGRA